MRKYKAEFGPAGHIIEVVYWIDEQGRIAGEAYFRHDDFCAEIINGDFAHPYSGLQYKLHVPTKSQELILDVLKWANVGRSRTVEVNVDETRNAFVHPCFPRY